MIALGMERAAWAGDRLARAVAWTADGAVGVAAGAVGVVVILGLAASLGLPRGRG